VNIPMAFHSLMQKLLHRSKILKNSEAKII